MDLSAVAWLERSGRCLLEMNMFEVGIYGYFSPPIFFWTKNQKNEIQLKWEHPIGVKIWPTKSFSKIPTDPETLSTASLQRFSPGDLAHRNGYAGVTSHFAVRDLDGWPPENWGMTIVKPSKHIFIQRTGGRDLRCDLWKRWLLIITFSNDLQGSYRYFRCFTGLQGGLLK